MATLQLGHGAAVTIEHGQACRKNGRLSHPRGIELILRSVETDARKIESQPLAGLVEQPPRSGESPDDVLGHAHELGALSGKQEGDFQRTPPEPEIAATMASLTL